jgi:hypothetical protein
MPDKMNAEMIAAMMEAGMMDPKMDQLKQQMAQAEALRTGGIDPSGKGFSVAGGLAGIGTNIMGGLMGNQVQRKQNALMDQSVAAKKLFLERLLAGQGAPQAPTAAPQAMPMPNDPNAQPGP